MINVIKLTSISILFLLLTKTVFSQTDTIVVDQSFRIVERYQTGQVKLLGQFKNDCDGKSKKHGQFMLFNKNGQPTRTKVYCQGRLINRKILLLKHGKWGGCSGLVTKYFMGFKRSTFPLDPAPCM